jgi:hypothetical protein
VSPPIDGLLQAAAVAAALLVFAYKFPSLRRNRGNLSLRAFAASILLMGAGLIVLVDPAHGLVDRAVRVPNFASLAGDCIVAASACAALCFLAYLNYPPARAHRVNLVFAAITGAVIVIMTVIFFAIPPRPETPNYWTLYAGPPQTATFRIVYLAFLSFVLVQIARLTLSFAAMSARPSMRIGLRLVAAGGVIGQLWVALEVARALVPAFGGPRPPLATETVGRVLVAVLVGLIALGSTLPSWGPRLGVDEAPALIGDFISLQRLYPLWKTLGGLVPAVLLVTPRSRLAELLDLRDMHFRLYRRVVEMRDAIVLVKRTSDPRSAELALAIGREQGLPADELDVLVSAAQAASAVQRPGRHREERRAEVEQVGPGPADFYAEVRWLERLARCHARSALLRRVLRRLESEESNLARGPLAG